ncbi:MAG: CPBP family intramembrane metalloprotease [Leptospiraceae bacterium]|nr:CPBP family intramembrane metalloprotease [Leptospiraceae bacterium]
MQARALLTAILFEAIIGFVAVLLGWIVGPNPLDRIHLRALDLLWGLLGLLPMLLVFFLISRLSWPSMRLIRTRLDETLGPLFDNLAWFDLLLLSALAGVCEELAFRGWLEGWLAGMLHPVIALIIANLLFGAAHWITTTYAIIAALMGALLSAANLYFDNLLVPVTIHAVYDFIALYWYQRDRLQTQTPGQVS